MVQWEWGNGMRLACLIGISCLVAACGDDGASVSIGATEDNYCNEIAEVACSNLYNCCTEGEIEEYLSVSEPRSEAQCREDLRRACERSSSALDDSLAAGRVTLDTAKLDACLEALIAPSDTCATVVAELPWSEVCEGSPWSGTVLPEGSCFFNHDCAGAPDAFCAPNQKCAAKPTAGFPCGTGCASDFYCSSGICQARLTAGAPCTSSTQCGEDLFCDLEADPMPVCAMPQSGGAACTTNQGCVSGTCIPGQCMGTTQSCYRDMDCGSRCADDGSSCTTSAQCASGTCQVGGNLCSSDANCTAGVGDTCVFPVLCLPGECIGDPVCTADTLTVDYCTGALSQLPLL
jgi:hypothetical protein